MNEVLGKKISNDRALLAWVDEMAKLCQPENVFWCDGSELEIQALYDLMVRVDLDQAQSRSCRALTWPARTAVTWPA